MKERQKSDKRATSESDQLYQTNRESQQVPSSIVTNQLTKHASGCREARKLTWAKALNTRTTNETGEPTEQEARC